MAQRIIMGGFCIVNPGFPALFVYRKPYRAIFESNVRVNRRMARIW